MNKKIQEIARIALELPEATLLIAEQAEQVAVAELQLAEIGVETASDWGELLTKLKDGQVVAYRLSSELAHEIEQLLAQYGRRNGRLQITDTQTLEYHSCQVDLAASGLILIAERSVLNCLEQRCSLLGSVGATQLISGVQIHG